MLLTVKIDVCTYYKNDRTCIEKNNFLIFTGGTNQLFLRTVRIKKKSCYDAISSLVPTGTSYRPDITIHSIRGSRTTPHPIR